MLPLETRTGLKTKVPQKRLVALDVETDRAAVETVTGRAIVRTNTKI